MDDAPLVRCKLTSHDAEKLWYRAATWRERRRREERCEGQKKGEIEGWRERQEERRRETKGEQNEVRGRWRKASDRQLRSLKIMQTFYSEQHGYETHARTQKEREIQTFANTSSLGETLYIHKATVAPCG